MGQGCPTAASLDIRVSPAVGAGNTVCSGQPFTVQVNPACGGPGCDYDWTTPVGTFNGVGRMRNIGSATTAHQGTWTVSVNPPGPCPLVTTSIDILVSITPELSRVGVAGSVCYRDTLKLYAIANIPNTSKSYLDPNSAPFATISEDTLKIPRVNKSHEGTWTVVARNIDGCESVPSYINVKVEDSVVADFEIINLKPGQRCNEDTIIVLNKSTWGNSFLQWDFDFNNPGTRTSNDTSHSPITNLYPYLGRVPPANGGYPREYVIRLLVAKGQCRDTAIRRDTFNHPLLTAFDIQGKDSICQGLTPLTFENKTTDPAPGKGNVYTWSFGDGTGNISSELSPTYTFTRAGVHTVKLLAEDYLGCKDSFERKVFVDSTGPVSITLSDENVCPGKAITFKSIFPPIGLISTLWDFGDGNTSPDSIVSYNYDLPSSYTVKFNAKYRICPEASVERVITVKQNPIVNLGNDTVMCPGAAPLVLTEKVNAANPDARFRWNTPTKDSTSSIYVRNPGTYSVTATVDGCSTTDSLTVWKDCYIDVPNAFTPNGDGDNDYFLPRQLLSKSVKNFTMTIYNRWGTVMFETTAINGRGWDGRLNGEPQPVGVYVYLVEATLANGTTEKYQGNLTLLR
jgi:gliding motility-associated-like protein